MAMAVDTSLVKARLDARVQRRHLRAAAGAWRAYRGVVRAVATASSPACIAYIGKVHDPEAAMIWSAMPRRLRRIAGARPPAPVLFICDRRLPDAPVSDAELAAAQAVRGIVPECAREVASGMASTRLGTYILPPMRVYSSRATPFIWGPSLDLIPLHVRFSLIAHAGDMAGSAIAREIMQLHRFMDERTRVLLCRADQHGSEAVHYLRKRRWEAVELMGSGEVVMLTPYLPGQSAPRDAPTTVKGLGNDRRRTNH